MAVSKDRPAIEFYLYSEIAEDQQNEENAEVEEEAGVEWKLSTKYCSWSFLKVGNCEEVLNRHFCDLRFVITPSVFILRQDYFHEKQIDWGQQAHVADKDHNSVEEVEVEEDYRPGENSEENIWSEDWIELEVVLESVRLVLEIFLYCGDGYGQDRAGHWQDLSNCGAMRVILHEDVELEAELSWSLNETFNEFILRENTPKDVIVTEDCSETDDKSD